MAAMNVRYQEKKGTSVKLNALRGFLIVAGVSWGGTVLAESLPDPILTINFLWTNAATGAFGASNILSLPPMIWDGTSFPLYSAVNDFNNSLGPGSAQLKIFPAARVTASTGLITNGSPGDFTTADAVLTFDFTIVGPTPGTVVPVNYAALMSVTGADSQTYVNLTLNQVTNLQHVFCGGGSCPASFLTGSFTVRAGQFQLLTLGAAAHTETGQSAAEAWIDPYIYIDPTWAAANPGYSVIFSAGIPNAAAPIPPAAWLFGSALGLIGLRRRAATNC